MKVYNRTPRLVRISFGSSHSVAFEDTTVQELFDLAIRIFSDIGISRSYSVSGSPVDHQSFQKILLSVRESVGSDKKGKSLKKTLYCITGEEAKEYFMKHYESYY